MSELQDINRASQQLARKIQRVADKNRRAAGFVMPFFDADPDEGDPTTMWGFNDNRIRFRKPDGTIREIVTTAPGAATSSVALPTEADIDLYSSTYAATWGRAFCDVHGVETGTALGYGPSTGHGVRKVMIGFDQTTIAADLAGAVIRSAELSMVNLDATTDPVPVTFGVHTAASVPASYSATRRNVWTGDWPRTGTGEEWRQSDGAQLIRVAEWLRDGVVQGLTVEQPGSAAGELSWSSTQLRISYTQ